jgi:hypothetical protein
MSLAKAVKAFDPKLGRDQTPWPVPLCDLVETVEQPSNVNFSLRITLLIQRGSMISSKRCPAIVETRNSATPNSGDYAQ